MRNKKIVIFGSGNVAFHIGKALLHNNYSILQVVGRSEKSTYGLSELLNCSYSIGYGNINNNADVYILAVNDASIAAIVDNVSFGDKLVIHTSGSITIDVFKNLENYGVIYPLQTFSKQRDIDMKKVPLFVEASNEQSLRNILSVAKQLSNNVELADSLKRMTLHLSAVFACNFTNHMLAVSEQILLNHNLKFDYLKPLIIETLEKALQQRPFNTQTGPAVRNDHITIDKHLELLADSEEYQKLYSFVSESIIKMYSKHNK